jgi:hypothetical protein
MSLADARERTCFAVAAPRGPSRSGRQILGDPTLRLDCEQQRNEPANDRDRCKRSEDMLDTQVRNDRTHQDRTDRRSGPEQDASTVTAACSRV